MFTFADVIQAPMKELYGMTVDGEFHSQELSFYAKVLHAYLQSDSAALLNLHSESKFVNLNDLILLRYQILVKPVQPELIQKLWTRYKNAHEWQGEIAFVIGYAHLDQNEYQLSREAFKIAYKKLTEFGAKKKAVKALMNVVVSEDRLDNSKKCITSYEFVKEKALEVEDNVVAGLCYHNIAKEYHKLRGLELALKYSNLALDCLNADRGVNHFFEALLERCHILIELERFQEALIDFQTAKASKNTKISEALKAVEILLGDKKEISMAHLEPAWRTKLISNKVMIKQERLTKLESEFVEIIARKPLSKRELVKVIYGDKIDSMSADNRLNVFLTRFKKKFPGTLVTDGELISIADNSILETFSHEAI